MAWRKPNGEKITGINDMDTLDIPDRMVAYPLNLLAELILEELAEIPNVSIHWNHRVAGISQTDERASVNLHSPSGPLTLDADLVVGCDGARSGVRKALFGRDFKGYTWDKQIVTTNVGWPSYFPAVRCAN